MKRILLVLAILILSFSAGPAKAQRKILAPSSEIFSEVAQAIWWVKPRLSQQKVERYAKAITFASLKYSIDPLTLVAIAYQESSFREDLPVGKAGEIGLLQIRKIWLKNKMFRKAFKNATVADLKNPDRAFVFAAWILHGLKKSRVSAKLPYWTYYNSKKFRHRFTYYMRVKRHLSSIAQKKQRASRMLAKNN